MLPSRKNGLEPSPIVSSICHLLHMLQSSPPPFTFHRLTPLLDAISKHALVPADLIACEHSRLFPLLTACVAACFDTARSTNYHIPPCNAPEGLTFLMRLLAAFCERKEWCRCFTRQLTGSVDGGKVPSTFERVIRYCAVCTDPLLVNACLSWLYAILSSEGVAFLEALQPCGPAGEGAQLNRRGRGQPGVCVSHPDPSQRNALGSDGAVGALSQLLVQTVCDERTTQYNRRLAAAALVCFCGIKHPAVPSPAALALAVKQRLGIQVPLAPLRAAAAAAGPDRADALGAGGEAEALSPALREVFKAALQTVSCASHGSGRGAEARQLVGALGFPGVVFRHCTSTDRESRDFALEILALILAEAAGPGAEAEKAPITPLAAGNTEAAFSPTTATAALPGYTPPPQFAPVSHCNDPAALHRRRARDTPADQDADADVDAQQHSATKAKKPRVVLPEVSCPSHTPDADAASSTELVRESSFSPLPPVGDRHRDSAGGWRGAAEAEVGKLKPQESHAPMTAQSTTVPGSGVSLSHCAADSDSDSDNPQDLPLGTATKEIAALDCSASSENPPSFRYAAVEFVHKTVGEIAVSLAQYAQPQPPDCSVSAGSPVFSSGALEAAFAFCRATVCCWRPAAIGDVGAVLIDLIRACLTPPLLDSAAFCEASPAGACVEISAAPPSLLELHDTPMVLSGNHAPIPSQPIRMIPPQVCQVALRTLGTLLAALLRTDNDVGVDLSYRQGADGALIKLMRSLAPGAGRESLPALLLARTGAAGTGELEALPCRDVGPLLCAVVRCAARAAGQPPLSDAVGALLYSPSAAVADGLHSLACCTDTATDIKLSICGLQQADRLSRHVGVCWDVLVAAAPHQAVTPHLPAVAAAAGSCLTIQHYTAEGVGPAGPGPAGFLWPAGSRHPLVLTLLGLSRVVQQAEAPPEILHLAAATAARAIAAARVPETKRLLPADVCSSAVTEPTEPAAGRVSPWMDNSAEVISAAATLLAVVLPLMKLHASSPPDAVAHTEGRIDWEGAWGVLWGALGAEGCAVAVLRLLRVLFLPPGRQSEAAIESPAGEPDIASAAYRAYASAVERSAHCGPAPLQLASCPLQQALSTFAESRPSFPVTLWQLCHALARQAAPVVGMTQQAEDSSQLVQNRLVLCAGAVEAAWGPVVSSKMTALARGMGAKGAGGAGADPLLDEMERQVVIPPIIQDSTAAWPPAEGRGGVAGQDNEGSSDSAWLALLTAPACGGDHHDCPGE